jgi:hypothetical protein
MACFTTCPRTLLSDLSEESPRHQNRLRCGKEYITEVKPGVTIVQPYCTRHGANPEVLITTLTSSAFHYYESLTIHSYCYAFQFFSTSYVLLGCFSELSYTLQLTARLGIGCKAVYFSRHSSIVIFISFRANHDCCN